MTDDSYRGKVRATFLAAIMVVSMVAMGATFAAPAAAQDQEFDDGQALDGENIWQGQEINVTVNASGGTEEIDIERVTATDDQGDPTDTTLVKERTAENGNYVIDTATLDPGESYVIRGDGSNTYLNGTNDSASLDATLENAAIFDVIQQDLSVEYVDDDVTIENDGANTEADIEFSSARADYQLEVTEANDDLTAGELEDIFNSSTGDDFVDSTGDGVITVNVTSDTEYTLNFTDITAGEYVFEFDAVDTTASTTLDAEVLEADVDKDITLVDDQVEVPRGGVAEFDLNLEDFRDDEEFFLQITDGEEGGYTLNATGVPHDEGEVTVRFNTYVAGSGDGAALTILDADDNELDSSTIDEDTLAKHIAGDTVYEINAAESETEFENGNELLLESMYVGELQSPEMALWRAPNDVWSDVDADDPSTIYSAIDDGGVTETDEVVYNADDSEYLIHQVTGASSIEGLLENKSTNGVEFNTLLNAATENNSFNFSIEQTGVSGNVDPKEVDLDQDDFTLVPDFENDTVFVVLDVGDAQFDRDEAGVGAADGDTFETELEITDEHLIADASETDPLGGAESDSDLYVSTTASFDTVAEDSSFSADPYEVPLTEEAEVTVDTNLAPGTEGQIRLRSDVSEERYRLSDSVTVNGEGVATGTFDLTGDGTVGDTVTLSTDSAFDTGTIDGEIIEGDQPAPADVQFDYTVEPAEPTAGDDVTVTVTAENAGGQTSDEVSYEFVFNGETQLDGTVQLDGGESTSDSFTVEGVEAGDYDWELLVDGESAETGTVTVAEAQDGEDGEDGEDGQDGEDGEDGEDGTDGVPGFGVAVAVLALLSAALLARFRN